MRGSLRLQGPPDARGRIDNVASEREYNLIPPEGDKDVGKKIFMLLEAIIKDKEALGLTGPEGRWIRNHELVHGRHWRNTPRKKVPLVTVNLIKDHIVRTVNELTDNNPTFNVVRYGEPPEQGQENNFELIQRVVESWWGDTEQQDDLETSTHNNELYGITIEMMSFDDEAEYHLGEALPVIVDPFCFGFWPLTLKSPKELQKADALFFYYPMSVREARRKWPHMADQIRPDTEQYEDAIGATRREVTANALATGASTGLFQRVGTKVLELLHIGGVSIDEGEDQVLVVMCWCKDYTTVRNEKGEIVPKYKGYLRRILTCNDGKVILSDESNPNINPELPDEIAQRTYLYDKFPFYAVNSVKNTSNAWGEGDIEQLEQLNIELDKAISQDVLEKDRAVRRKTINPKTSGVDNVEFNNVQGIIRPVNAEQGAGIRHLDTPKNPVDIKASIELFKELFFRAAGTFDIDNVQTNAKGVLAYKAIAALLERAATMKRGKIRAISRLVRERGRMYVSMVQNFYVEDRFVSFQDKSGHDTVKQFRGSDLVIPAKLSVVSGSTMPVSQVQRREEAIELARGGWIDQEDLLDKLNWPSKNDIIDRRNKGIFGKLFEKLAAIGVPPEFLDMFGKIGQLDDKKFEQELKKGTLPNFEQILMNIADAVNAGEGQQQENPEAEKANAELAKLTAEAQKITAETQLVIEKIVTERVDQEVRMAGIRYDEEELKIRRAELIREIATAQNSEDGRGSDKTQASKQKAGYQERGMKSNNREATA
jgi:hypothetical protein